MMLVLTPFQPALATALCLTLGGGFLALIWPRATQPWAGSAHWGTDRHPIRRRDRSALIWIALFLGAAQLLLHILSHKSMYIDFGVSWVQIPASAALFPLTLAVLLYPAITKNSVVFGWMMGFLILANAAVAGTTYALHAGLAAQVTLLSNSGLDSLWSSTAWQEVLAGTGCFALVASIMFWAATTLSFTNSIRYRVYIPLILAIVVDSVVYPLTLYVTRDDALSRLYWPHVVGHAIFELLVGAAYGACVVFACRSHWAIAWNGAAARPSAPISAGQFLLVSMRQVVIGLGQGCRRVFRGLTSSLSLTVGWCSRNDPAVDPPNGCGGRRDTLGDKQGIAKLQAQAWEQFELDRDRLYDDAKLRGRFIAYRGGDVLFEGKTEAVYERLISRCQSNGYQPGEYSIFEIEPRDVAEPVSPPAEADRIGPMRDDADASPLSKLAQQAWEQFERDREDLLSNTANLGRFIAYRGGYVLFEGKTEAVYERLISRCQSNGYQPGEYIIFEIEPREIAEHPAISYL